MLLLTERSLAARARLQTRALQSIAYWRHGDLLIPVNTHKRVPALETRSLMNIFDFIKEKRLFRSTNVYCVSILRYVSMYLFTTQHYNISYQSRLQHVRIKLSLKKVLYRLTNTPAHKSPELAILTWTWHLDLNLPSWTPGGANRQRYSPVCCLSAVWKMLTAVFACEDKF